MKKLIIVSILLLGILMAIPVYASVYQSAVMDQVDEKIAVATATFQTQIDQLNQKNAQLELKLQNYQAPAQISTPQASSNDAGQTQRIDALEKRAGVIEGTVNALKTAINKTLNLLTKLLSLI